MTIAILAMMSVLPALSRVEGSADEIPVELPQSPDRPSIAAAELKGLRENNVFSPHRTKPFELRRSDGPRAERRPEAPAKPKPLVVTGLFSDPVTGAAKAIVEDRNEERHRVLKEPKFVVGGEEFAGLKIESVGADVVVVSRGDVKKECRLGDALPEADAAASPSAPSSNDDGETKAEGDSATAPAPAADDASKNDVLERLRKSNGRRRTSEP